MASRAAPTATRTDQEPVAATTRETRRETDAEGDDGHPGDGPVVQPGQGRRQTALAGGGVDEPGGGDEAAVEGVHRRRRRDAGHEPQAGLAEGGAAEEELGIGGGELAVGRGRGSWPR